MSRQDFVRLHARRLTALGVVVLMFWMALPPRISSQETATLVSRFHFTRYELPVPMHTATQLRTVQPSLQSIVSWISSVGAAVALADVDGDGKPNDLCYVDTNTNQVIVAPVPGSGHRYQPFVLDPSPLAYDNTMAPMGCLPGDFNEDGLTDLLVYYWGRSPIAFLQKSSVAGSPSGPLSRERFVPQEILIPYQRWFSNTATQADLDGDGHLDLVVGNYFPDGSHILDTSAPGFETMVSSLARGFNGGGPHFLLWKSASGGIAPDVAFEDIAHSLPDSAAHGWTLAVGATDLNGDMLPEIYLANDFGPDRLLVNRSTPGHLSFFTAEGSKGLTTPNSKVLGHDSFKGMGVDFGDLNQRGLTDIVVSNITSQYALEESNFVFMNTGDALALNRGWAPFEDQSDSMGLARSGWSWDVKLGDFDNSGQLEVLHAVGFLRGTVNRWPELQELAMTNQYLLQDPRIWPRFQPGDDLSGHEQNTFFVRASNGRYYDIGSQLGLDQGAASRSIATADVFGDGRLDFAVANQWGHSYFFHNDSPSLGRFVGLNLLLPVAGVSNSVSVVSPGLRQGIFPGRPAIGAQVTVHLPNGHVFVTQVDGGNGHGGKRSPEVQVGLGKIPADQSVAVDVTWRDAEGRVRTQTLELTPGWHTVLLASLDAPRGEATT